MRQKINFNRDWKFHKGDIIQDYPSYKGFSYISAKTERMHMGPACKDYFVSFDSFKLDCEHNPERWENVSLPHDYMLDATPDKSQNNALGFVKRQNAWYIKRFELDADDADKRITLLFEGVSTHATVYLNGALMKHNMCGYTTFEVDISDMVKFDAPNVLSVYVNTEQNEGWWYEGGGIYRNVWLVKTERVAIDLWGIYANPERLANGSWVVHLESTVRNDLNQNREVTVLAEISDKDGNAVAAGEVSGNIEYREKSALSCDIPVSSPELWSPDTPVMYTVKVSVMCGGTQSDCDSVRFGFRTFTLDSNRGLFINGKHYKIKGVCGHSSCGLTGRAIPDNLHRYRARLIKEMGANGYRTSHYPQSEVLMDALDDYGFIVMDETRWFESTDEGKEQLSMLVRRDRNHPCVFFWSIGNEEPHHTTDEGRRIASSLCAVVKKLDKSRAVIVATDKPDKATVYEGLDAVGINYCYSSFDIAHEKYPDKAILSTECSATGGTRGWYFAPHPTDARLPAYDRDFNSYFVSREKTWNAIAQRDFVMGGYQWISIDHRGEAVWPRLCSISGAYDMFYQRKDAFYQNLSYWSDKPMIHLLPHWNFEGLEGENIRVMAYTNADSAELFLNGVSLGACDVPKLSHAEWSVPYQSGELKVVAYCGKDVVATDTVRTTKKGHSLKLTLENPDLCANAEDIAIVTCSVLDEDGNEVPNAAPTVSFCTEGCGEFYSCGSDNTDHSSPFLSTRKMYAGKITVAVRTSNTAGQVKLFAHADGLRSTVLYIETK